MKFVHAEWCCLWVSAQFSESQQPTSIESETFLYSKPKFFLPTRQIKGTQKFVNFKKENWCMELANDDKLAHHNTGVKYPLVR